MKYKESSINKGMIYSSFKTVKGMNDPIIWIACELKNSCLLFHESAGSIVWLGPSCTVNKYSPTSYFMIGEIIRVSLFGHPPVLWNNFLDAPPLGSNFMPLSITCVCQKYIFSNSMCDFK